MDTFIINVPKQKTNLVKQLLKELGVVVNERDEKTLNKTSVTPIKKTLIGEGLTKSASHGDLMDKLNS